MSHDDAIDLFWECCGACLAPPDKALPDHDCSAVVQQLSSSWHADARHCRQSGARGDGFFFCVTAACRLQQPPLLSRDSRHSLRAFRSRFIPELSFFIENGR